MMATVGSLCGIEAEAWVYGGRPHLWCCILSLGPSPGGMSAFFRGTCGHLAGKSYTVTRLARHQVVVGVEERSPSPARLAWDSGRRCRHRRPRLGGSEEPLPRDDGISLSGAGMPVGRSFDRGEGRGKPAVRLDERVCGFWRRDGLWGQGSDQCPEARGFIRGLLPLTRRVCVVVASRARVSSIPRGDDDDLLLFGMDLVSVR